jgi:50S ribosomal protein L16 3-hydroxylase
VLERGDLLYLPPRYAHDGMAEGECQTYSIGFRSPAGAELARDLLQRLSEDAAEAAGDRVYRDPSQPATAAPGAIPEPLQAFAQAALAAALRDPGAVGRALGEALSEPKPTVWFEGAAPADLGSGVVLDRRTRMMYDRSHVFINGESYRASGRDAALMRALADGRRLQPRQMARASAAARALLSAWQEAGWLQPLREALP